MSIKISKNMSNKISKNISNKMSKNIFKKLPITKYINIMVEIIQYIYIFNFYSEKNQNNVFP